MADSPEQKDGTVFVGQDRVAGHPPATPATPWEGRSPKAKEVAFRRAMVRVGAEGWDAVARELGCSKTTVRLLGAKLGLRTKDIREAHQEAARPAPPGEEERPSHLPWSVLRLFDTVMPFITKRGVGGPNDLSTWVAWRTFLGAAFGCSIDQLKLDQANPQIENSTGKSPEGKSIASVTFPPYPGVNAQDVERGAAALDPALTPLQIYQRCTGRETWPTRQFPEVSLIVGRRGGKSQITAFIGVFLAVCREYQLNLGTKPMVMILARDKAQARVIRDYMIAILKTPPLASFLKGEPTKQLIELTNGITIEVRAVSMGGVQGYTVVAALLDEVAYWATDDASSKQDKEVLRAVRPTMLGVAGMSGLDPEEIYEPMIILLSSPYAKRGELYETYARAFGKDEEKGELVWNADTLSMRPGDSNPKIQQQLLDYIRREYRKDPENARAVYGAFFRTDLETIITRHNLDAVIVPGRVMLQPQLDKFTYRAFVDMSGGSSDSAVLAIGHTETRKVNGEDKDIEVVDRVVEVRAPFNPEEQVKKTFIPVLRSYGVMLVVGDAYAGMWPREAFMKNGVDYEVSEKFKSQIYLEAVAKINSRACELPDDERMIAQFTNLERRVGRSGRDSVDHPVGSHDDVANAVAGVITTATEEIFRDVVW